MKGISMMRVAVFMLVAFICMIFGAIAFHFVWNTITNRAINWLEAAAFIGAITTLVVGILYNKAKQREAEGQERVEMRKIEAREG